MQERFDKCLAGLLPDRGAVLLAVSGGLDSMVMADLFLHSSLRLDLAVAHCNFHLRGEESDSDEIFVRKLAEANNLTFFKKDFDTKGYSEARGISIEMAARALILNLLRGTGLKGACGISNNSSLPGCEASLIRPLLGFTREEIRAYALSRNIRWHEDSTNADTAYKRNRIRNEVFPSFSKINPAFIQTLNSDIVRFAQVRKVADDFFASNAPVVSCKDAEGIRISIPKLQAAPHREYLLYRLIEPYGFPSSVMEDITKLITEGATISGKRFFTNGFEAYTTSDSLVVVPRLGASGEGPEEVVVGAEGEYSLCGVAFTVDRIIPDDPRQPEGTLVVNLEFPFVVRKWRQGDWMRPMGMTGKKKLSDMFVDLKMSIADKEKALVIAGEGSHVLALLCRRIDGSVRIGGGSPGQEGYVRIRII